MAQLAEELADAVFGLARFIAQLGKRRRFLGEFHHVDLQMKEGASLVGPAP
jgi:hypothetical protein